MAAEARVIGNLALDVGPSAGGEAAPSRRRHPALTLRPLAKAAPPASLAALELGHLPARGLGGLPAAFTVRMRAVDGSVFHLSTSRTDGDVLAEGGAIVLDAEEWEALVVAVEAERVWPGDWVHALRARGVTGRLQLDALLDGVSYERATAEIGADGRGFSIGRVLGCVGARIEEVVFP